MVLMIAKRVPEFGLLTNPLESVPLEVGRIAKLGFDYVEIGIEEPNATPSILMSQEEEILSALARNRLRPLGHTAYWVGFGSSHDEVRLGWVKEGKRMIEAASQLGIRLLNFHFNSRLGMTGRTEKSRETFLQHFTDSITELTRFAAENGVELMLENIPPEPAHPLESLAYFSQIMSGVPSLKFHFDVPHAFIENRMKGVEEYLDAFADRLVHIHIHDNHGEQDEHLPLGRGKIDFKKVVRLLKEIDYNRTITFEVFTSGSDAVRSRNFLKKLWEKS
jgi:sugar phosphate isomerase/epimerase